MYPHLFPKSSTPQNEYPIATNSNFIPQQRRSQPQTQYQSQPQAQYQSQPQAQYQSQPQAQYQSQPQAQYQSQPQAQYQFQSENRTYHTPTDQLTVGFDKFVRRYEINKTFASKLRGLMGYEIVLICDDSGSMNTELGDVTGPYQQLPTRWDELKHTVSIVVDLASVLDPDGVDIYFLNREPMLNVRSSQELIPMFAVPPEGPTPIVRVMRQILQEKRQQIQDRKLLLLIATDGVPTDDDGHQRIEEFRHVLKNERIPIDRIPVTIIACTADDDNCMAYLNNWDKTIPNLDVVDDYKSEKKEILACQGPSFPFSFGDYVVKILMGGVDSWFDQLDEVKVTTDGYGRSEPQTNSYHGDYNLPYPPLK